MHDETQQIHEDGIQQENEETKQDDRRKNDTHIFENVLRRRPNDLFDLALAVAENFPAFFVKRTKPFSFFAFSAITSFLALLRLSVERVLLAESAVLVHLKSVGIILLVLLCVVVALFAFSAS